MARPRPLLSVVPGQIDLEVFPGRYVVAHAATTQLPFAGWLLTQTLLFKDDAVAFSAVIVDDEGATLVLERTRARLALAAGLGSALRVEEDVVWTALHLQLGQTANDVPGLISHMAKALMRQSISILHYSTYGTEVFLVREENLEDALACFATSELRNRLTFLMAGPANRNAFNHEEADPPSPNAPSIRKYATPEVGTAPCYTLSELDQRLFIVRLKRDYFHEVSRTVLQLFLYDLHYQRDLLTAAPLNAEGKVLLQEQALSSEMGAMKHTGHEINPDAVVRTLSDPVKERESLAENDIDAVGASPVPSGMRFVLGFIEAGDEITLLLDEDDLQLFPEEAIEVCPTAWRGVKLTGRAFALHECGVVSAMSKVDDNVSILSLSTYETTITMVAQEHMDQTVQTLSSSLGASVVRSLVPHVQDPEALRWA